MKVSGRIRAVQKLRWRLRKVSSKAQGNVLEPGAVGKAVRHDNVLVEVVGAR